MTTDEKAKAFDEALERAKKLKETCDNTTVVGWCEYIFPELRESEDEKIRKKIISALNRDKTLTEDEAYDCISWLEKQVSPDMVADAYLRGCNDTEKKWLEKQKDTNVLIQEASEKAYTEGMRVERKHWLATAYAEQKLEPTCSEEDEKICQCLINDQEEALNEVGNDIFEYSVIISGFKEKCKERIEWLKSLKDRLKGG